MKFLFQQSRIWDSHREPDSSKPVVKIKARSEERARRRLPHPEMGREWILVQEVDD